MRTTDPSVATANRFDREFRMGRKLLEQFQRPFVFAPACDLELLDFLLSHAGGDGGKLSLDAFQTVDGCLQIVGRGHLHARHPA